MNTLTPYDISGGIATVTLNRPQKLNAISYAIVGWSIGLRFTLHTSRCTSSLQSLLSQFNSTHHRAGLVARFFVFMFRIRVGNDAGSGLNKRPMAGHHHRSDVDAHIHIAGKTDVSHRPRIRTALGGLQLVDNLHRSDLGRAGHGAGREAGHERVQPIVPLPDGRHTISVTLLDWAGNKTVGARIYTQLTDGLAAIDALMKGGSVPGPAYSPAANAALFEMLEKRPRSDMAARGYWRLKGLVVHGYFTSERVQKEVLKNEIMPGRYVGDAPHIVPTR